MHITALGRASGTMVFAAHPTRPPLPLVLERAPRIFVFSGEDGSRMAIVANDEAELNHKRARALQTPADVMAADGVYYRRKPITGEVAFVFPGAAAAYHGAGRSLLMACPDIVQEVVGRAPDFAPAVAWMFDEPARPAGPDEKLAASTLLCQAHARLTLNWFGLKPQATIGFSAGETNTLLAFDVWRDADRFFSEFINSGVFRTHLSGKFETVNGTPWETWAILASGERLREVLDAAPQLRVLAIHAPGEYLIAGPSSACAHALARVDRGSAQRIDFDMVVHCPDLQPFAETWHKLHHRETFVPVNGPRFYQLATGRSYELSREAIADALTSQALHTLADFPRVIRHRAWNDGVRVFLEHGPRGNCTAWIRKSLGDREHVAISLDAPGADSLTQAVHTAAQLIAAGIDVDLARLEERLWPETSDPKRRLLRLPAHPAPVKIPPPPAPETSRLEHHMKRMAEEHARFHETSTRVHQEFLATSQRAYLQFTSGKGMPAAVAVAAVPVASPVVFTRDQLEVAASGRISEVYGREFQELDSFRRICRRLPMPPLLLVDRA